MSNVETALRAATTLDGAVAAAFVDYNPGLLVPEGPSGTSLTA